MAGASAYPRKIDFKKFREIADACGAYLMVDMAHIAGLVAAGEHESPVPYADVVTTTTHKTLRGPRGGMILCKEQYAKAIDKAIFPGTQGGPLEHIIAAKAVCFKEAMSPEFKAYQHQIVLNAQALAQALMAKGLKLVSGGTDNHLMLINLTGTGITGKALEKLLGDANITANKNTIPFETQSPFITSGVRLGTPAVTTRGMKEAEMEQIAGFIARIVGGGRGGHPPGQGTGYRPVRQVPPVSVKPITVIGGANVDLCGSAIGPVVPKDSNPGRVRMTAGGVGRNIAESLARLGLPVRLICAPGPG